MAPLSQMLIATTTDAKPTLMCAPAGDSLAAMRGWSAAADAPL
jgi:hypothetical protein